MQRRERIMGDCLKELTALLHAHNAKPRSADEAINQIFNVMADAGNRLRLEREENPAAFDCYEIRQVVEYRAQDGSTFCEPLESGMVEEARKLPDYHKDFWTLYGHMASGGVMAIADYQDEQTCVEVLRLIGGERSV